jgi:hypothetical protein
MRLFGNIPCGCDSRDEIIFKSGHASWSEAALLAAGVLFILAAYYINHNGGHSNA